MKDDFRSMVFRVGLDAGSHSDVLRVARKLKQKLGCFSEPMSPQRMAVYVPESTNTIDVLRITKAAGWDRVKGG